MPVLSLSFPEVYPRPHLVAAHAAVRDSLGGDEGAVLKKVEASLSLPHSPVAFPPNLEELPAGLESRSFSSGLLLDGTKMNTTA